MTRLRALALLAFLLLFGFGPMPDAGANDDSFVPTPCEDCSRKNAGPGKGSGFFFAFECVPDGSGRGRYIITYTNRSTTDTHEAVVAGATPERHVVPPGGKAIFVVPFTARATTITWQASTSTGRTVIPLRSQTFDCPCELAPPSTPPTSPPVTAPPSSPPVSVPGTSSPPPTVPGTPPVTLPATGGGGGDVAWVGAVLVLMGVVAAAGASATRRQR